MDFAALFPGIVFGPDPGPDPFAGATADGGDAGAAPAKARIQRASRACLPCIKSRRRCEGAEPGSASCLVCSRRGVVCEFNTEPPKKRGPKGPRLRLPLLALASQLPPPSSSVAAAVAAAAAAVRGESMPIQLISLSVFCLG